IEALIFRALAKDREKRFQTAYEFGRALEAALPALPETVAYQSTIVAALPVAQSVVAPQTVARRAPAGESTTGHKRNLYDEVARALGEEQYAKADAALQTLKMHLGVKAETDGEFRRLRKELEAAAAAKET